MSAQMGILLPPSLSTFPALFFRSTPLLKIESQFLSLCAGIYRENGQRLSSSL